MDLSLYGPRGLCPCRLKVCPDFQFKMARPILSLIVLALAAGLGSAAVPRGIHKARVLKEPAELEESYDYVIVGGGTAGLTVADRLAEDEGTTVLVVEYGVLSK